MLSCSVNLGSSPGVGGWSSGGGCEGGTDSDANAAVVVLMVVVDE